MNIKELKVGDKLRALVDMCIIPNEKVFTAGEVYCVTSKHIHCLAITSNVGNNYFLFEDHMWINNFKLISSKNPKTTPITVAPKEQKIIYDFFTNPSDLIDYSNKLIKKGWIIQQILETKTQYLFIFILNKY